MVKRTKAYPDLERDLQFFPLGIKESVVVTPTQIDSYNKNGYFFPLPIFNKSEIILFRDYFDDLFKKALLGWLE